MSYSLDFCRQVALDRSRSTIFDRNWNNAVEMESESTFDAILNGIREIHKTNNDDYSIDIVLHFAPDADFQYFTSESCVHDGTLVFVLETLKKCAQKVCCGSTYYRPMGSPQNGTEVHFTVGNFILLNEYDESGIAFAPTGRKWMSDRTTVLLPLRMEYKTRF